MHTEICSSFVSFFPGKDPNYLDPLHESYVNTMKKSALLSGEDVEAILSVVRAGLFT